MSKKAARNAKRFAYQPTTELPPLGKIQTEWNLKEHYYTSETDPRIEKDAKTYERKVKAFVKKYQKADFTSSAGKLLVALTDYEQLVALPDASRVVRYLSFRTTLNVNDTAASRLLSQYAEQFRKLSNELLFFSLTIGKIPKKQQQQYLKDDTLKPYRYYLKTSFEEAKHHLSEAEERILTLRSHTSSDMWPEMVDKIISNRTVTFQGKKYHVPEALEQIDLLSWVQKEKLWQHILDEMVQISEIAEHELTAIVLHKKTSDDLRGYKKPYSATVLGYENDERAVEALVEAISSKGFALSRKFYKLKAKLHDKKTIPYVNKYDSIGAVSEPDFAAAIMVCRDVFYGMDSAFGSIFDRMLENGHVDVFARSGKRGGAFMAGTVGLPTYVMLNHKNNFKSLETLAHEIGHAIHAELSKSQPALYEDFSTTTAETASTLFEQAAMEKIYSTLPKKQKVVFLHNKIARDIATVQRQIAFYNFEFEMHTHVRSYGLATKEELAAMMQKHLQSYLGSSVEVSERDGYSYVYVPHVRYGFYVYTYAYGHLVSNLMLQRYAADPSYLTKINQFLHAGGSDTVENIFGSIGINTRKVETFLESLKTQEREIEELERLTK